MFRRAIDPQLTALLLVAVAGCGSPSSDEEAGTTAASSGATDPVASSSGTASTASPGSSSASTESPTTATSGTTTEPPATDSVTSASSTGPRDDDSSSGGPARPPGGIWISVDELMALPTSGAAWEAVLEAAQEPPGTADLSDQTQTNNVTVLAMAYVCVRTQDDAMCEEVRTQIMSIPETENGGRTLALGRELMAYVVAADLVGLSDDDDTSFRGWLDAVRSEELDGRTLISTHEDRPNNWGTHAGASRIAAAIYLGDDAELERAASVLEGFLGNRDAYAEFSYGELSWQADPDLPVGINPVGATIEGNDVDGVIGDDQRRGGPFSWPPPQENYVYENLQGALAQAVMLDRRGYGAWGWGDEALRRAYVWLHEQADYPAGGDDRWQIHLVNHYYNTDFPVDPVTSPGKNVGFTGWTHQP